MKLRKPMIIILTLLMVSFTFTTVSANDIELRVMTVFGSNAKVAIDELFKEYTEKTGIKIIHEVAAGGGSATYQEVLKTGFANGTAPDVFFEWGGQLSGVFIDEGYVESLEEYYKKYDWHDRYIGWAVEALRRNGKLYGVPISSRGMTFWYRKDLMEDIGAEVPNTYEELEELCRKAKAAGIYPLSLGGKYGFMTARLFDYLIEVVVGPELHDKLNALEADWDREEVVEAFTLFKKWVDNGWITPGFVSVDPDTARFPVYQGSALMVFEGDWLEGVVIGDEQNIENFDFFIHPTGHDPNRIAGFPEQFMINANSKYKEEAAAFIDWVTSVDVMQKSLGTAFSSTATIGVAPKKEELPRTYKWRQILPDLNDVYPPSDQVFKTDLLHQYFEVQDGIALGELTPEEAAKQFQEAVEKWKMEQ